MVLPCVFAVDGIFEYLNNGQSISGMLGIPVPVPEGGDNQIRHTYDVSGRAGSTFGGAQGLAMYLVMTLGFAIAHVVHPPRPWMRRVGLLCLAVSAGGLAVAQSRGGLLGAAALLLAIALTLRPTWRLPVLWLTVVATCVGVVVLGLWPSWDGTLAGLIPGRPEAVLDRLIIWGVALDVASENPLLGVGLGNFRDAFFEREAWLHVDLAYPSLHAHNTYLELLADTGWLGLCAYVGFLVAAAARLQRLWRNGAQPVLTLAAIGALAAYAVFASVDMLLLQNMHLLLVLVLSLGLATSGAPAVGVAMRLEDRR
jgi:O-antigen ligase